jgi:O-antigen/teichoic acid export membrane protein
MGARGVGTGGIFVVGHSQDLPSDKRGAARIVANGGAARLLSLPIGAICTAITAWVAIRYVGMNNYGYVNLVATLFLLVPFADFGLGVVVVNTASRIRPERPPTAVDLQTIWRVFVRITLIAVVLSGAAILVAATGGWSKLLGLPGTLNDANFATGLALAIFFLAMPLGVGQRIMVGLGRIGEMTAITITAPLLTTLCTCGLAWAYVSPMFLALAPAIGIFVSNLILLLRSLKYLGVDLRDLRSAAPDEPPERLAHSAVSYFVVSLGIPLAMQSDRLILAHFSTAMELSVYSLMAQMYVPALSVITTGAIALWPAYKQRSGNARSLWISALKLLTILGGALAVAFGFLSPVLARVISSDQIRPSVMLAFMFAALIVVMSVHQASGLLLTDESGLRFQAYCVVALAIVSVSLSILLAGPLGAVGTVLASVIAITAAQLIPGIMRARKTLMVVAE